MWELYKIINHDKSFKIILIFFQNVYPLKEFASKQMIEVYVIGEYLAKRRNYLKITHQNHISFKECALKVPAVPTNRVYKPGDSFIGFVKEVS